MQTCTVCGSEMTGFTTIFCPRCEESKAPTEADKALGIPRHVGDQLRAVGAKHKAATRHPGGFTGGGPGAGQTIKGAPLNHTFGRSGTPVRPSSTPLMQRHRSISGDISKLCAGYVQGY